MSSYCVLAINACTDNGDPCMNGGQCVLTDDSCTQYRCECPGCYTGPTCEQCKCVQSWDDLI